MSPLHGSVHPWQEAIAGLKHSCWRRKSLGHSDRRIFSEHPGASESELDLAALNLEDLKKARIESNKREILGIHGKAQAFVGIFCLGGPRKAACQ